MSRYGQRPENALKRANEFIDVGKPSRALDTLYEVFRNKKWTYSWSESVLEPIMFKYLDLCVELKKSLIAKEGLFQYRNMFQSVNVGSLENVIRGYLRMAEEKTEAAREQSQQAIIDIDDLDNLATPESILLSAVSGEDAQDRSDRTILTPWVKFLWESYCQCLELLRTNAHCETLYHDIARMAFQFCLKYNRKTEFRKLCDKLRKHLEDIAKLPIQVANVSLNKPETQQYNLETRLVQLDSAIQMELWQEAYKAIEDIHGLMNMSKKPPVPKTMANYYQKLAMVFWKAGQYLFHAAALFKLFQLSKDMKKNITGEELQRMACRVLLATLCIPLPSAHPEFDRFIETDKSPLEKAQRLAVLLTLQQPPTRVSLIRDLVRLNVVQLASPQLQELYQCLELDFNPLTLCKRVQAITQQIQGDEQYIPPLQDVTLVKLIKQVSQVYQSIKFSRLLELTAFTTPFHLERVLVDCVRHNDMQIRIEHSTGSVHFGIDLVECPRQVNSDAGPILQSMPSEQLRTQLINMSHVLNGALRIINPNYDRAEKDKVRLALCQFYEGNMQKDHQRILGRQKIIEDRKEYLERLNIHREEEEAKKAEEAARLQAEIEKKRLEEERKERERKRQENELQLIKDKHIQEKVNNIRKTVRGQKLLKKYDEEEIKKLNPDEIAAKEAEEMQKEKREIQQKLKSQEKKIDYFERAKRIEEIPLLQQAYEEKQVMERKRWEEQEQKRIEELTQERQIALEHRKRLGRMAQDCQDFINILKSGRNQVYTDKMKEFEARLVEERKKRLAKRKEERRIERMTAYENAKEQERLRKEEEAEKKKQEEERIKKEEQERLEAIKRAEKEEEDRKKREALDRQAEVQRKREEEASRRLEEKLAAAKKADEWRKEELRDKEISRDRDSRPPPIDRESRALPTSDSRPAPSTGAWRSSRMREGGASDSSWRRGGDDDRKDDKPDRRDFRSDDKPDRRDFRSDDKPDRRDFRSDDKPDRRDFRSDDKPDRRDFRSDDKPDRRDFRSEDKHDRRDFRSDDRDKKTDDDKFRRRPAESSSMSSWRARGSEPDRDDKDRRDDRRDDRPMRRDDREDRRPIDRDEHRGEIRRAPPQSSSDKERRQPPSSMPPGNDDKKPGDDKKEWRSNKPSGEDSGDDGSWKKVLRR